MPLKLIRLARSKNWYVRGTVRGQRLFESTGTDRHDLARAYRDIREREVWERRVVGGTTFAAAVIAYLEAGGSPRYLDALVVEIGGVHVGAISQKEIDDAAAKLYPLGSPDTRRRQAYVPAAAVLHHAARRGECAWLRVRLPRANPARTRYLTPEEASRLIGACKPKLRSVVLFLIYTGARLGEALALDWSRVDLRARQAFIPRTKTGKPRTVHLPGPVLADLAAVKLERREGPVFAYRSRFAMRTAWRTAVKRAEIADVRPHDLRHTYATWMRLYGRLDLRGLMDAGGWASLASVLRYEHVIPGEAAKAADLFPVVRISRRRRKGAA